MSEIPSIASTVPTTPRPSGRWVVVGMFVAGLIATAIIFLYWDQHTKPFRALTEAVGREYRHSLPKVEGGRHRGGENTLRVAMRVPFVPLESSAETQEVINRVVELSREHADLSKFEVLEVHLIQLAPEQTAVQKSFRYPVPDVLTTLPFAALDE